VGEWRENEIKREKRGERRKEGRGRE